MIISLKDNTEISPQLIYKWFESTRFRFKIEEIGLTRLKLREIRLKENKPYCGSHPESCVTPFGAERKVYNRNYLEGSDWVDFNDRLNDCLDYYCVSANVKSSVCIIRKRSCRRTVYGSHQRGMFREWNMDEPRAYDDYCSEAKVLAPDSFFPEGTPGEYTRNLNEYA